jgi:ABC-type bacteriocin/lantibiotic exporter with double-glycine peptidase domain
MVCAHLGTEVSEAELRRLMKTKPSGTSPANAVYLSELGFDVRFFSGSLSELRELAERGVPVIVLIWTESIAYWSDACMHAITVVGFEADALLIHDPAVANSPIRVSVDQFETAWAYSRQLSIQIELHVSDG